MKSRSRLLTISALAFASMLLVLGVAASSPCRAAIPRADSDAERYVLDQLRRGLKADLKEKFPADKFSEDKRVLRGEFLKELLTNRDPQLSLLPEITISHSIIVGDTDLRRAEIPYEVTITDSVFNNVVNLKDSHFAKSLLLVSNIFKSGVFFNRAVIDGGLGVRHSSFGQAEFHRLKVGGGAGFDGVKFDNKSLSFVGARIGESFIMSNCEVTSNDVEFGEMHVESFAVWKSTFKAAVPNEADKERTETRIGLGGMQANDVNLIQSKFLNFSIFSLSRLQTDQFSVVLSEVSPQPKVYRQFMSFKKLAPMNLERLNWLLTPYDAEFYATVEGMFRAQGYTSEADELFLRRKRAERAELCYFGDCPHPVKFMQSLFLDWFAAYGKRLQNLLYWSVGFIIIGTLVFRREQGMRTKDAKDSADKAGKYNPFWYSLDLFLPIIRLGEADLWTPKDDRRWASLYQKVHIIIGSLFVPIGLAAWTGIIK